MSENDFSNVCYVPTFRLRQESHPPQRRKTLARSGPFGNRQGQHPRQKRSGAPDPEAADGGGQQRQAVAGGESHIRNGQI